MELARQIMTIGLTLLLVITIYDFNSTFFNKVYRWNQSIPKILLFFYFLISIASYSLGITGVTNLMITFCFCAAIAVSYQASMSSYIFGVLFLITLLMGGEMSIHYIYSYFSKQSVAQLLDNEVKRDYLLALSRFIPFIMIKIFSNQIIIKNNRLKDNKVKFAEWVLFVLIPMLSLLLMHFFSEVAVDGDGKNSIYVAIAIMIIISLNIIFYMIYYKTIELAEYRINEILYEKQLDTYNEEYDRLKESLKDYEIIKHDLKNSIVSFWADVVASDTMLSKEELRKQLNTFIEEACPEKYASYTGYMAVDMILNAKVNRAKKSSINIDIKYSINLSVTVENKVICVVLGNALDNAIEACEKFHKDTIEIRLKNQKKNLYIEIRNGYEGEIKMVNGFPVTQKENKRNHGYGLRSIFRLVEEHGGLAKLDFNNGIFTLQLYFTQNLE